MFNNLKLFLFLLIFSSLSLHSSSLPDDRSQYGDSKLLSEIFLKRHSGINFEIKPVGEDQKHALIQAARWSPSSFNDQPWNFIFCDRFNTPEAYLKAYDSIYGQDWIENVPLFVIVIARTEFRYNGELNEWAHYDTGAAALAMSLQATDMGLMAHQIGGFDKEIIKQEFYLPDGYSPLTIIAIGYEDTSEASTEEPRTRYPINENFFSGEWERSLDQTAD